MPTGDSSSPYGKYIFAAGEAAAERLRLLDRVFNPTTRELLANLGLAPGWRVADIGCGIGLNAMWMAKHVAPDGSVTGIDMSHEQMRIASATAEVAGLKNALFQQGTATGTGLPRAAFDLVYSRFLLCHLTDPIAALGEMRSLLKSGGLLVCEDFISSTVTTYPETRAYVRLSEIYSIMDAKRGVDSNAGAKLHQYLQSAGFQRAEIVMRQPAFLRGEEKRFWEMTLREAVPAIVEAGVAREEDIEQICEEMRAIAEDEAILLAVTTVVQGWARK